MSDFYTVELGEFPVVGVGRHLTLQLRDESGNRIVEVNGLATKAGDGSDWRAVGFGFRGDTIKIFIWPDRLTNPSDLSYFGSQATRSINTVASRPLEQLQRDLTLLEMTKLAINGKDLLYHLSGLNLLREDGSNSNSAAVTILKVLGVPESVIQESIDGLIVPGRWTSLLLDNEIAQLQNAFEGVEWQDIEGEVTAIDFLDSGVIVISTDNPGSWTSGGWDSDGDGKVTSSDDPHGLTDPPPMRPEGLGLGGGAGQANGLDQGNSTYGSTALAPAVAVRPQIRPDDLNTGSSGSSSNNDNDDDVVITFNGGTYDPNKVVITDGGPKNLNPILLDLDGNGIQLTDLTRSTVFMEGEEGLKHRTAWAGAGDGVLFYDTDGDSAISDIREYVFTEWDPTAKDDLAALRARFDTNGDGKLMGTELNGFKVMKTNPDGALTAVTLASLGITQINLTEDTTHIEMPDGSVITGQGTFVMGGVAHALANTTLTTEADGSSVAETVSVIGGVRTAVPTGFGVTSGMAFRHRKSEYKTNPFKLPKKEARSLSGADL